jgi:hypothetical protein
LYECDSISTLNETFFSYIVLFDEQLMSARPEKVVTLFKFNSLIAVSHVGLNISDTNFNLLNRLWDQAQNNMKTNN